MSKDSKKRGGMRKKRRVRVLQGRKWENKKIYVMSKESKESCN